MWLDFSEKAYDVVQRVYSATLKRVGYSISKLTWTKAKLDYLQDQDRITADPWTVGKV